MSTETDPSAVAAEAASAESAKDAVPNRATRWAGSQARRTGDGARHLGAWLGHWASTADQSGDEIRRRIIADQLEAHNDRRTDAEDALIAEVKKIVRLEEEASDGGLTQAQRGDLTFRREAARRLEKSLNELRKDNFRPVQPTERQIARARSLGRLRRGAALLGAATATVMLAVNQPALALLGGLAATGLAWWTGTHPPRLTHRPIPEDLLLPELAPPAKLFSPEAPPADATSSEELFPGDTGKPFPVRDVTDPALAAAGILRALAAEGLAVGSVTGVTKERWGWRAEARLTKGKPADLVAKLANLDVLLGVRQGGVMAQPQKSAAASVVLRIVTSDAFDPMPPHPAYPPRSNSIKNPMVLGPSMDATPTEVTLAGQNVLLIASPGGGKSAVIRSLVDYITSCTDAIAWDIDPTGRGFGPLRRLAARKAYTPEDIDDALDDAIAFAKARAQVMDDDVDNWQVTDESPAGFVFVDEHPQLTPKQKAKVIDLMRIGRKARFTVVLASQDATADVVGDAVADVFGIRIMLPCRKADVPLVVGSDTAISEGWMPHRLTPSPGDWDLADAGCFYIIAPGLADPILRKATFLDAVGAKQRAVERLAAGLPALDPATTRGSTGPRPEAPAVLALLRDAFTTENAACLTLDQLHAYLVRADPQRWGRWDVRTEQDRLREVGKALSAELRRADIDLSTVRLDELDGSPRGIRRDDLHSALRHYA
ncbi:hypothetical protein [Kitasatospora sp. P5_F3]